MTPLPPCLPVTATLFPHTTLFRSVLSSRVMTRPLLPSHAGSSVTASRRYCADQAYSLPETPFRQYPRRFGRFSLIGPLHGAKPPPWRTWSGIGVVPQVPDPRRSSPSMLSDGAVSNMPTHTDRK